MVLTLGAPVIELSNDGMMVRFPRACAANVRNPPETKPTLQAARMSGAVRVDFRILTSERGLLFRRLYARNLFLREAPRNLLRTKCGIRSPALVFSSARPRRRADSREDDRR